MDWVKTCMRRKMVGFHVPDYDQIPEYSSLEKAYGVSRILEKVDPEAFVKGAIRHPDHKTVVLSFWHRVVPNAEASDAVGGRLVFLD